MNKTALISVIVIIFRMSRQASNTLFTLSTAYQRNVSEDAYEVIVVENASDDILGEERALSFGENFRYFLRYETSPSPVKSVNFGFSQSRAPMIGFMIDGARMLTPRVIEYALYAQRITPYALVDVPGYHLGTNWHQFNQTYGYNEDVEKDLLGTVDWKQNGYLLFEICSLSEANRSGYLSPIMECNCLFCSRESFEKTGRADERFNLPGGGMINLHLLRCLSMLPESKVVVLPGEGSFHQYHGGVTTQESGQHEALIKSFHEQYEKLMGHPLKLYPREPMMIGAVTGWAQKFLQKSAEKAGRRFLRLSNQGEKEWPND